MSLGARLRELRIKKNRSLQNVADAVKASKAHIWEIEKRWQQKSDHGFAGKARRLL